MYLYLAESVTKVFSISLQEDTGISVSATATATASAIAVTPKLARVNASQLSQSIAQTSVDNTNYPLPAPTYESMTTTYTFDTTVKCREI